MLVTLVLWSCICVLQAEEHERKRRDVLSPVDRESHFEKKRDNCAM